MHKRVHPRDLPLLLCQCRSTSGKTRGTNVLGFPGASSKGALIGPVIGVFLWHPQSPALYAITSWVSWLIPQEEKVQAGAKQQQTQVWAHLPPVPGAVPPSSHTLCHPRAGGDHPSSLQTRLAAGCDGGTPQLRTTLRHSPSQTGTPGASRDTTHTGAWRTGLGTAVRGTEGHRWGETPVPWHLRLLPTSAERTNACQEHRGSCSSRDWLESSKPCPHRLPPARRHCHRLPRASSPDAWL